MDVIATEINNVDLISVVNPNGTTTNLTPSITQVNLVEPRTVVYSAGNSGSGSGTVSSVNAIGNNGISVTGGPITGAGVLTISLSPTAVTPGNYINANITVDAEGRITSATNGTAVNSSVVSFNSRVGSITLQSADVVSALGYTPARVVGNPTEIQYNLGGALSSSSALSFSNVEGIGGTGASLRVGNPGFNSTVNIGAFNGINGVINLGSNTKITGSASGSLTIQVGSTSSLVLDSTGLYLNDTPLGAGYNPIKISYVGNRPTVLCQALYLKSDGTFSPALASGSSTKSVFGIIAYISVSGYYLATSGIVTATTVQWDAVTGQVGGLTIGSVYFLSSSTQGNLTKSVPTSGYLVKVGEAISSTQLLLTLDAPVVRLS